MTLLRNLMDAGGFEKIKDSLEKREVKSVDLVEDSLKEIEKQNKEINAVVSSTPELALEMAKEADLLLDKKQRLDPLCGVPVGVKDLILVKDYKATAASKMLKDFIAPYDATVSAKLKESKAPIVAKLNLDEFAMGSSNENSFFGPCSNPWDTSRVAGGSSGGSAASVASAMLPVSLGTDTGGSIRQPSALCGLTGIKPTYGRVSRYGVVAFASSLDQVGSMAVDAFGAAATLESISGFDKFDANSSNIRVPSFYSETKKFRDENGIKGMRIGMPKEFFDQGVNPEVKKSIDEALELYQSLGAKLVEVSLPHVKHALATYYIICTSEASSNLARFDGIHYGHRSQSADPSQLDQIYSKSRGEAFGDEVKLRILMGTFSLSSGYYDAYYKKASQVRQLIYNDYASVFEKCDFIASPTSPFTAFKKAEKLSDPMQMYLSDIFTLSTNLAALPGISFNVGYDQTSLPIGMQLMAPWWKESDLLGSAALYQKERPEHTKLAPVFSGGQK